MYTDDIVFWALTKNNKKDHHQLLENFISKALSELDLRTENDNTSKTLYQFFTISHQSVNFCLQLNNKNISKSNKYLGVILDNELN